MLKVRALSTSPFVQYDRHTRGGPVLIKDGPFYSPGYLSLDRGQISCGVYILAKELVFNLILSLNTTLSFTSEFLVAQVFPVFK